MFELISSFEASEIKWIVVLIVADVILGIVGAFLKKDFRLGKLANFMFKPVLGYVLGFAVLGMVVQAWPSLSFVVGTSFVLIVLALAGSIIHNLAKMGVVNLKLPSYLKKD